MRYAYISSFTACVATIYLLTQMAADYADPAIGHGLHPALAMLGGVVMTVLGWACLRRAASE
jgi:hypothetical protein